MEEVFCSTGQFGGVQAALEGGLPQARMAMEFHSDASCSCGKTELKSVEFPHSYGKTKLENFVPWKYVPTLLAFRRILHDHSSPARAKYARGTHER